MTDDTISRQAAIDTAEWVYRACEGNFLYYHDLLVAALMDLPSAQPTMYGYDIKTLAFVAGVMEQEGVTPEEAVATFRDIQKCVDYIWSDVHKTIQKSMDDVMNHDCSTCLHSDRMPHIYPCDKCSTGHERWERKA